MRNTASLLTFLAIAVATIGSTAFGQIYSDVSGTDLNFTSIVETSGGNLFGQPDAIGNNLNFAGTDFSAQGVDGSLDFLNGMLELTASANSGMTFNSVSLDEFGVYFNTGDSVSTVDAFLTVVTADGTFTDEFNFSFGEGSGSWAGTAEVTFPETVTANVFIHNILFADSDGDEVASINKRDVTVSFGTVVVPEPSSVCLLAAGMVGLITRRRR